MINSIANRINPIIIIPQGSMQDRLFFCESGIEKYNNELVRLVYSGIGNVTVPYNLIRIHRKGNRIIVFHIYPTNVTETISDRKGQNVVIGYLINRKFFVCEFEKCMLLINCFFEIVALCCRDYEKSEQNIPSQFLQKYNVLSYNRYILSTIEKKWKEALSGKMISFPESGKLNEVYRLIRRKVILKKEFWCIPSNGAILFYDKNNLPIT